MFSGSRARLIEVLVTAAIVVSAGTCQGSDAHIKTGSTGAGTGEWTEKEKIGSDVPLETWRDNKLAPSAALLCVHGLGLHNTSYAPFGKKMADIGVATYALDVRGFGSWQNTNENKTVDFAAALRDIKSALLAVHKAHPKIPVVLLGESMGGALAIQATAMNESLVDGLIASVPSGMRYGEKLTSMKVMVGLFSAPHKQIKMNKIVNRATGNPELRQEWEQDPNARMTMSPKELLAFQTFMEKNVVRARQITQTPVLFVQGGSDRLVKPKGTVDLFKDIRSPEKDFVWLGDSEHLIFEEGQFDQHVIDVVSSWIEKHVVQPFAAKQSHPSGEIDPEKAHKQAAGRLLLAQGYIKLEDYPSALAQLKQVLELGRGSKLAQDAHELMLGLPIELIAPRTGPATKVSTAEIKFTSHEGAMQNDKPSVLVFCADWVKPCKDLDQPLKNLYDQYGANVNFVHIDADDQNSQNLVKKYGIGPLPAILYLSGSNEVMSYTLGVSDEAGMRKEILKLIGATTAHAD